MSESNGKEPAAAGGDERPRVRTERGVGARATGAEVTGASATGLSLRAGHALGSLALGSMALGALAVGALAIGRLVVKRAVVAHLEAGTGEIRHLKVGRLGSEERETARAERTTPAGCSATDCAWSSGAASTMTRTIGSVPLGLISTRPVSPRSASAA